MNRPINLINIQQNNIKNRNESLDMISGILIFWMMVYHVVLWANIANSVLFKTALRWFFFFMAWFYFKSGMFFKPELNTSILKFLKKRMNSIIVPLLFWFTIGYCIIYLKFFFMHNKPMWKIAISPFYLFLRSGDTPGNDPLWFLVSLFFVQVLSFYVVRIKYYFILILLLLPIGLFLENHSIILPLGAHSIPLGLFFYFAGYYYSKHYIKFDLKYFIIIIVPLFIIINILFGSYVNIHSNYLQYGNYLSFILLSLLAIIISIYCSKYYQFDFLVWSGQKSMHFLVLHWPVFYLVRVFFYLFKGYTVGYDYALALVIVSFPICILAIKTVGKYELFFGK